MKFKILKDGEVLNTIVASPEFVADYCRKHGFIFEEVEEDIPSPVPAPEPEPETTVWDELDAAYQEGVNSAYDS